MRTVEINGLRVELYDDIESLPILRFHKYNKMLLVDSGIGSDLNDFDKHIEKAIRYAKSKTPQMAAVELENMRQNVYFIQSNISPKYLAFAVLVKSINGKPCNDLSDDGLQRLIKRFENVPHRELADTIESVKKKIDEELRMYFPKLFDDAVMKEYYDKLRERTLAILDTVISGEATKEDLKKIEDITTELFTYFNPHNFVGSDGVEVRHDKQFENMCLVLSQNLNVDPKKFTVLEYYNAFEYIKEQNRKQQRTKNANKAF